MLTDKIIDKVFDEYASYDKSCIVAPMFEIAARDIETLAREEAVAEERNRCKAAIAQVEAMCVSTPEYIATCDDFTERNQAYSDGAGEALDNLVDILFPEPTEKGDANA